MHYLRAKSKTLAVFTKSGGRNEDSEQHFRIGPDQMRRKLWRNASNDEESISVGIKKKSITLTGR